MKLKNVLPQKKVGNVFLSFLGIGILVIGLIAGRILISKRQIFTQKAAPLTKLTLIPDSYTPKVGENFNITVGIETGENEIIGAELNLFVSEPSSVEVIDIFPGDFLPGVTEQTKTINNSTGFNQYLIFLPPLADYSGRKGIGVLATILAKALMPGQVTIGFSENSQVAALGVDIGQNVLLNTVPVDITIQPATSAEDGSSAVGGNLSPTVTLFETPIITKRPSPTRKPTVTPVNPLVTIIPAPQPNQETTLPNIADVDGNGCINLGDLWIVIKEMSTESSTFSGTDVNNDGKVDFDDFWSVVVEISLRCKK